jgi:hypothetical protein
MPPRRYLILRSAQRACPRPELGRVSKDPRSSCSPLSQFLPSLRAHPPWAPGLCPLKGTYREPICERPPPGAPLMPEIVADPLLPYCYHLFPGPGMQEFQEVGPDPFLPRARDGRGPSSERRAGDPGAFSYPSYPRKREPEAGTRSGNPGISATCLLSCQGQALRPCFRGDDECACPQDFLTALQAGGNPPCRSRNEGGLLFSPG